MPEELKLAELISQLEKFAKAEKLEGDNLAAAKGALENLAQVPKGTIPKAVFSMMADLAGHPYPAPVAKSEDAEKRLEVIKKAVGILDGEKPDTDAAVKLLAEAAGIKPMKKSVADLPPELKTRWELMQKSQENQAKELETLKKSLDAANADAKSKEFLAKAEGYKNLPIETKALGALMQAASELGEENEKNLTEFLAKSDKMIGESEVLKETGSHQSGGAKGWEAIEAKARTLVEKSENKLTIEQAINQVMEADPSLYEAYEDERGAA